MAKAKQAPPNTQISTLPTQPHALAPVPAQVPTDIAEAFRDGMDVQIPVDAERVEFVPSYTVPIGATVQGIYGGSRTEEVIRPETGEVQTFESHLFRGLNGTRRDVWLRGGWNFSQLIKLAKTELGQRITMRRGADRNHPRDPRLRIAQFDYYRG